MLLDSLLHEGRVLAPLGLSSISAVADLVNGVSDKYFMSFVVEISSKSFLWGSQDSE